MPEVTAPDTATAPPVPVDTTSAPMGGQAPPAPAAAPAQLPLAPPAAAKQMTPTPVPAKPGEFFHNASQSFMGAVLGSMAGRERIASYTTDETGKQTPVTQKMTTGDQLRSIARSALLGLAAGSRVGPQKSGLATGLAGLGAGAEDAVDRAKQTDLLQRKQSTEEFERGQQALTNRATNAHTAALTAVMGQELFSKTLESQEKVADLGRSQYNAMVGVGNAAPVSDMHKDELLAWRDSQPDKQRWMDYTPLLTRVTPKEGAVPDPKTGMYAPEDVDRRYSLVDLKKDVPITQEMKDHLMTVNFPGADALTVGRTVPGAQYAALWNQGLMLYNQQAGDPKNKDVIDVTGPDGTPMKAVYNKALRTTEILRGDDGKPLGGKVETEQSRIMGADGKTYVYLINKNNGQKLKNLGEAGSAADNTSLRTLGDYGKTGDAYLATVEQPFRNNIKTLGDYNGDPSMLGRGGNMRGSIMSGVEQYQPGWSEALYPERKKYIEQYQNSQSGDGAARSRINTALGHLDMLGQAADGVSKNDLRALNQLANEYGIQTDQPGPVLYNLVAEKAATEAAAATGNQTKEEIESQRRNLQINAGPLQQHEQIEGNIRLLKTQADTLENNFKQAMGASSDELKRPVIYPQNKPILEKWTAAKNAGPQLPPGAIPGRDASGKIVGYKLNGQYVSLQGGK